MTRWTPLLLFIQNLVLQVYGVHKSCDSVRQAGLEDGYYDLDPEQDGLDEFPVYCNTSSSPVSAILHHNREDITHVSGYEGHGSYIGEIVYGNGVTYNQTRSLVMTSSYCHYSLWIKSVGMYLGANWWESYFGDQREWESLGGSYCMQANGDRMCECFKNANVLTEDSGDPGNWVLFPIVTIRMGDNGESFEWAEFQFGPMICYQDEKVSRTFKLQNGKRQTAGVTLANAIKTKSQCALACLVAIFTCVAFNIQVSPAFVCELVSIPADAYGAMMVNDPAWGHYAIAV